MTDVATKPRNRREAKAQRGPYGRTGEILGSVDDRFGLAKGGRTFLDKIFPDHWSFMLGEIALYSFVILLLTGVFLTLYYVPSQTLVRVPLNFPYKPLRGQEVSQAFMSTIDMTFNVRCGLLMRQMHHWACDIFVGAIVVHMARVFFTGAFRKPRETNWFLGVNLLVLAIVNGFIGYSLPDDLVSGTGLRIAFSIMESIPFVGSYLAFWVFGGNFPGTAIIPRFYTIHVLLVPGAIMALLGGHLALLVLQKHTQFKGKGRTERNVVGSPMFPVFMGKTTGFLFMTIGVTALLGAFFQINPIWQFGPYTNISKISYAVQPDWYMGWLDGALRIMPAWEWTGFGHTIPLEVFLPAVVLPGIIFTLCMFWPWMEAKFTKDYEYHNLLDRPRDRPKRTAAGAAMLAFLGMLFIASSTDVLANFFHIELNWVLWAMRILVIVAPIVAYPLAWKICREMQGLDAVGKRKRVNVVVRTAEGEYVAVPSAARPGDGHHELDAISIPDYIEDEPAVVGAEAEQSTGVRTIER